MKTKKTFTIELTWKDESSKYFKVEVEGTTHEIESILMWITRGTLMATYAIKAICYNDEGFDVMSYTQY